jgi:hypothetical protein
MGAGRAVALRSGLSVDSCALKTGGSLLPLETGRTRPMAELDLLPTEASQAGEALHNQGLTPIAEMPGFHHG